MDLTIINLITILIGGSGLFVVLTKFNVPELNKTFLGENPFAVKRDKINYVMTWIFASLALVGLIIQVFKEIFIFHMPERIYNIQFYIIFFLFGCFIMVCIVLCLSKLGNYIARKIWLPIIVERQRELFQKSQFVIEHDGWTEDQYRHRSEDIFRKSPDTYKAKNLKEAKRRISQIEKLLELKNDTNDLKKRIEVIRPFFHK